MTERDHEKPKELPVWMTTMTDMNMLLMVFFIALFSLGLMDRPFRQRVEEQLRGMGRAGRTERAAGAGAEQPEETAAFPFDEKPGRAGELKLARTSEGTVITVGGDVAPFDEGSYALKPEHLAAIAEVRRWLHGQLNVVSVRGHTAGNEQDSVVIEDGRVRPWRDARDAGDPWLLSCLRANAVREELVRAGAEPRVDERRVRVRGDAYLHRVTDSFDEIGRRRNRRVEIVVTSDRTAD